MGEILDNSTPKMDNSSLSEGTGIEGTVESEGGYTGWKDNLSSDLANSPLVKKFDDTQEGLAKAMESYANLEKLLGHEKVPIPKGDDDIEGWNRFSKALGIPDKAEGYGLSDPALPETMAHLKDNFNKQQFSEIAHGLKLTPKQTKALWEQYVNQTIESYGKQLQSYEKQMTDNINALRGEWGDAYDTNVELGQMVINKFAGDKDANDWLTATLSQNPIGIKFLAKLGNQFAENKIGEFQVKRFSLAPEEAMNEIDKIVRDPNHPYNSDKATNKEHQEAIDYVNRLYSIANRR